MTVTLYNIFIDDGDPHLEYVTEFDLYSFPKMLEEKALTRSGYEALPLEGSH